MAIGVGDAIGATGFISTFVLDKPPTICYHMVTYEGRRSDPWRIDVTQRKQEPMMIKLTSVYVDDQEKAMRFSTDVLGFVKFESFDQ